MAFAQCVSLYLCLVVFVSMVFSSLFGGHLARLFGEKYCREISLHTGPNDFKLSKHILGKSVAFESIFF